MKTFSNHRIVREIAGRAFTLIELLMVIAIIGILAALLIGSSGYASRVMKISRVTAELKELETAISDYKAVMGFYPPDNSTNAAQNQLLYELMGTSVANVASANPVYANGIESINAANVSLFFGVPGFQNVVVPPAAIKSFLPKLRAKQFTNVFTGAAAKVLVVPVDGPTGPVNPWRYVSTSPTNNPRSFDLWAEIVIGGSNYVIGNWKK